MVPLSGLVAKFGATPLASLSAYDWPPEGISSTPQNISMSYARFGAFAIATEIGYLLIAVEFC